MAIVTPLENGADGRRRLALQNPATREAIGEITVATPDDVAAAIARARAAQPAWGARPVKERAAIVAKAVDVLIARTEDIVATVRAETGKPRPEALAIEVLSSIDVVNFWSARATKELSDEWRGLHGYLRPLKKLLMTYEPLGVIGVITPWNGPFALSLTPTVQALLAGNAVVLKPSEVTPHSGGWAVKVLHEAGVPEDVLQCVIGDGETGAALVTGDVDKISFTGSVATGKKIALACAARLTPCTLELGGKDALIVCDDADIDRAAIGAVYLAMFNTGQVCLGTERVYVVERHADEFIKKVVEHASALRYGSGDDTDMGPLFWDKQLAIVERHVEDARSKGAKILVGGGSDTAKGVFYKPTVVVDVTHDMDLMRDETFGPVVAIMRVKDEEEAIRLANDCRYGLSASVFTKSQEKAIAIGRRLQAGSVVHNDAAVIYGVPEAPFGGVKESGLGQVNGLGALRSYSRTKPILLDRWGLKKEDIWYPYGERTLKALEGTIKYAFGPIARKFMT